MALFFEINLMNIIIAMLVTVIFSSVSQYIQNKKAFYSLHIAYVLLSIIFPGFFLFYPVCLHDIIYDEKCHKYSKIVFAIIPLISLIDNSLMMSAAVFVISVASALLALRTSENEQLNERLIVLRDNTEENQRLLIERNKYLALGKEHEINLAVMSERNRIAREIHDNVGHTLSRTLLQMGALKVINKDEQLKPHLEEINNSLNSAMTSMRESVHNLHDDSISVNKTVEELVNPLSERFTIRLDIDISEKTPKEIKLAIIGIVKEAVSNIIRHSNGDKVVILMREHPAFYQISVEDNGKNNSKINNDGIGLENMKIRAENLGGLFKVDCEKDRFRVFVSIPKVKE